MLMTGIEVNIFVYEFVYDPLRNETDCSIEDRLKYRERVKFINMTKIILRFMIKISGSSENYIEMVFL